MGTTIIVSCINCKHFKRGVDLLPRCKKGLDAEQYIDFNNRCLQWEERDFSWLHEKYLDEF